jgi:hypothetical protein
LIGAKPVGCGPTGNGVVIDNYGSGYGLGINGSQMATTAGFTSQAADDFTFDPCDPMIVNVEWVGRFSAGPPVGGRPFNIYFYPEAGTGGVPAGGPDDPSNAALEIYENIYAVEIPNGDDTFTYQADLPWPFVGQVGQRYWIAIQWHGPMPPEWGLADAVTSNGFKAKMGCPAQGIPYWSDLPVPGDLAFKLSGSVETPETGACCLTDGTCQELFEDDCRIIGGLWNESGTTCAGTIDACCLPSGDCAMLDAACCEEFHGGVSVAGAVCTNGVGGQQACCFDEQTCLDLDPVCCAVHPVYGAGTTQGPGTACGADCNSNGVTDGCETIEIGDFDVDQDTDLDDFAAMVTCLGGPSGVPTGVITPCVPSCLAAFDFEPDGDIDLADFAEFQRILPSGPEPAVFYPTDDVMIDAWIPTANYNSLAETRVRNGHQPSFESNTLIRFDISSIPPATVINSATLHLYYFGYLDNDPVGRPLTCRRLLGNWDEATVTFANQPGRAAAASATAPVPSTTGEWMTWDVTADVQGFINGTPTDYGWIIIDENAWPGGGIPWPRFRTKEYSQDIPHLIVE